jgi:hypothetical protein
VDENGGMIVEIDPGSSDDSSAGSDAPDSQVVVNAEDNWAAEASKAADREEESQNSEEEMQEIVIQ